MDSRYLAQMSGNWYKSIDLENMKASVIINEDDEEYEIKVPIKFEVCPICNGKGKHIDPLIDAHGISAKEFEDDPNFYEEYRSGYYDVDCYKCGGRNVVPVVNKNICKEEDLKLVEDIIIKKENTAREIYHEIEMGY